MVKNIVISLSSVAITILFLEIIVRIIGHVDESGQFYFLNHRLLPYKLQTETYRYSINRYLESSEDAQLLYDERTGWILNPQRDDVNSYGMRNSYEPEQKPASDVIRIALFGDSFTEGTDVEINENWATVLEECLNEREFNVEILNFGVQAYGIDQAYLRYETTGVLFEPDIVLFGFHPGDIHRNVTAFRPLVGGTLAFSKPRFILQDDELLLLNHLAIPPEELLSVYENFQSHPLFQYEMLYDYRYDEAWWSHSRLLSLGVYAMWNERSKNLYEYYTEGSYFITLTEAIIRRFGQSVLSNGSEFIMVHLPGRNELSYLEENGTITYFSLLNEFAEDYPIIYPESGLESANSQHWTHSYHYSSLGNEIIGNNICNSLM